MSRTRSPTRRERKRPRPAPPRVSQRSERRSSRRPSSPVVRCVACWLRACFGVRSPWGAMTMHVWRRCDGRYFSTPCTLGPNGVEEVRRAHEAPRPHPLLIARDAGLRSTVETAVVSPRRAGVQHGPALLRKGVRLGLSLSVVGLSLFRSRFRSPPLLTRAPGTRRRIWRWSSSDACGARCVVVGSPGALIRQALRL